MMKIDLSNEEVGIITRALKDSAYGHYLTPRILGKLPTGYKIGDRFKLCNWSDEVSGTVFTLCLVERPDKVALVDHMECYGEGATRVTDPRSITDDDLRNITGNRVRYFKKIGEE